jgi:hypothetical protein
MEAPKLPVNPGSSTLFFVIAIIAGLAVGLVAYKMVKTNKTIASGNREGFQGPSRGVSDIRCGQESSYAIEISDLFYHRHAKGYINGDLTRYGIKFSNLELPSFICRKHFDGYKV